jgi:hypothetical protein
MNVRTIPRNTSSSPVAMSSVTRSTVRVRPTLAFPNCPKSTSPTTARTTVAGTNQTHARVRSRSRITTGHHRRTVTAITAITVPVIDPMATFVAAAWSGNSKTMEVSRTRSTTDGRSAKATRIAIRPAQARRRAGGARGPFPELTRER